MPTVVVILPSNTYRATDFLSAAESLGVDLVVASDRPPPMDMGDRYLDIDCADVAAAAGAIVELGDRITIDGVIAADDAGVLVAAEASSRLGLLGNTPGSAAATRDKAAMRALLARSEVDQPAFATLGPNDDAIAVAEDVGYPLVVKPVDRSASQGVIRVDRPSDIPATVRRVRDIVGDDATLIVEGFLTGDEIAIEGMITDGKLTTLAVFDKPDTSFGPYFPETLFVTPSRLPDRSLIEAERVAAAAVRGVGLTTGPVHIELKVERDRARIIEIAARSIGGLCSRSLNFGLMGTTLESLILRNSLGLGRTHLRREPVSSGVLMIPTPASGTLRAVGGQEETRRIPGITGIDLTMVPGDRVYAPPDGERYLGFVYARADRPEEVESALRKAMSTLEVQLEG
ncbi:MAG: ATP-grasp domain-containing protein [Acidimicrobiia bacterium]